MLQKANKLIFLPIRNKISDVLDKTKGMYKLFKTLSSSDIEKEDKLIKSAELISDITLGYSRVKVKNVKTYDNFYSETRIDDSNDYWFENVYVDKKKWFLNKCGTTPNKDIKIHRIRDHFDEEFHNCIDMYFDYEKYEDIVVDKKTGKEVDLLNMRLQELEENYKSLHTKLLEHIKEKIKYDLNYYNIIDTGICELFGIEYPEETFNEFEILAYWTVYFSPDIWDEEIAWNLGLFPFEYNGENLLALGGCGMDLSPALDAYQALTAGSIPSNSRFLDDYDYAKYVVGENAFNKVMEKIKTSPTIKISV